MRVDRYDGSYLLSGLTDLPEDAFEMREYVRKLLLVAVAGALVLSTGATYQLALGGELPPNPIQNVARYYEANAEEIATLSKRATDFGLQQQQRVTAFIDLFGSYPEACLPVAAELVDDPSQKLATYAIEALGSFITMDPSAEMMPSGTNKYDRHLVAYRDFALDALRTALEDNRAEVRREAAITLVSRGDTKSIETIAEKIVSGDYDQAEGLVYLGLAPQGLADRYIAPYLDASDPETRAAAVAQLADREEYRAKIREYVESPTQPEIVREAAIRKLALTDPEFLGYGLPLVASKNVSKRFHNVLADSIALAVAQSKPTAAQRDNTAVFLERVVPASVGTEYRESIQKIRSIPAVLYRPVPSTSKPSTSKPRAVSGESEPVSTTP